MRKFSFLIFILCASLCITSWMGTAKKKKGKKTFTVTGTIMQTTSYCGGAQPSPDMLARCNTPMGIPNGKLFVKKGTMNKERASLIDSIRADANGKFSIQLPAGNYCLVEDWKAKPFDLPLNNEFQTVDSICYRNMYDACDYELNITDKNIDSVKIVFHRSCFYNRPCISYHGPLPPMAVPHQEKNKIGE